MRGALVSCPRVLLHIPGTEYSILHALLDCWKPGLRAFTAETAVHRQQLPAGHKHTINELYDY